jgi:hypothetical protein
MDGGGRFYTWNGQKFYSTTTIIGALAKPGLIKWAADMAAERAMGVISNRIQTAPMRPDQVQRWIADASNDSRNKAAKLGSRVHDYVEQYIAGNEPSPDKDIEGYAKQWDRFVREYAPRFTHSECTVFNRSHAYAGTLDGVAAIGGQGRSRSHNVLFDIKSGNNIYGSVALQLAAYRYGEFIGHVNGIDELPMPEVMAGAVLHLRPRSYKFIRVDISKKVFNYFLFIQQAYIWSQTMENDVLLGPYVLEEVDDASSRYTAETP